MKSFFDIRWLALLLVFLAGCGDSAEARRAKARPSFEKANEIRAGRQEEAIALYSEAIAADPDYAEAYHNRALSYAEMYDFARAEADLDKVKQLGLDSTNLEAAIAMAKQLKADSE